MFFFVLGNILSTSHSVSHFTIKYSMRQVSYSHAVAEESEELKVK